MRFWLGGLAIVPAYCLLKTRIRSIPKSEKPPYSLLTATLTLGFLLFTGAALQQIGIIYTTAGKAGFITSLYIVFVPVVSLLFYNPLRLSHLFGCVVALIGVYFLSFHEGFDDANIGEVTGVLHGPAGEILEVRLSGGKDVLVPFVHAIVPEVDLDAGTCTITPPDGLLEL